MHLIIPNRPFPHGANTRETQLELVFELQQDRYGHRIGRVPEPGRLASASHSWLQTVQNTAAADWPCSPPLQQIHEQTIQGLPVIMAVGMAGGGHWSASFAATQGERIGLQVELAARVIVSDETRLTLRYHLGPQVAATQLDDSLLSLQHPESNLAFELLLEGCRAHLNQESAELELMAKLPEKKGRATVSWGYFLYSVPNSV